MPELILGLALPPFHEPDSHGYGAADHKQPLGNFGSEFHHAIGHSLRSWPDSRAPHSTERTLAVIGERPALWRRPAPKDNVYFAVEAVLVTGSS